MTDKGRSFLEPCPKCGARKQKQRRSTAGACHIQCDGCKHAGPVACAPCENPIGAAMVLWNRDAKRLGLDGHVMDHAAVDDVRRASLGIHQMPEWYALMERNDEGMLWWYGLRHDGLESAETNNKWDVYRWAKQDVECPEPRRGRYERHEP